MPTKKKRPPKQPTARKKGSPAMGPIDELQCLTPDEAAEYLRVSKATVLRSAKKGQLPHVRIASLYRFPKFRLDEYLRGPHAA